MSRPSDATQSFRGKHDNHRRIQQLADKIQGAANPQQRLCAIIEHMTLVNAIWLFTARK